MGSRTVTTVVELWYYYSPVCGSPTQWIWGFDFIVIAPLLSTLCLVAAFSLSLYVRSLFLWVPASSCLCLRFWDSGRHARTSFYSAILHLLPVLMSSNTTTSGHVRPMYALKLCVLSPSTLPPSRTSNRDYEELAAFCSHLLAIFLGPEWTWT